MLLPTRENQERTTLTNEKMPTHLYANEVVYYTRLFYPRASLSAASEHDRASSNQHNYHDDVIVQGHFLFLIQTIVSNLTKRKECEFHVGINTTST
jgi:hypothetical protein